MRLPPFLLDQWIEQKHTADPPIEFDLASSTGPVWTLRELLALHDGRADGSALDQLLDTRLLYTNAAGTPDLRTAIAGMQNVEPADVQIVTGAAEALLILFFLAAEPGANVVLPDPGFPANTALAESLGIEPRYYAIRAENNFRIDQDEIRKLVDGNTRFVLANSPHNPTGAVLTDDELTALHDLCAERGVQFICDEVYHPIYHGPPSQSAARLPHATVISDFSKALCLSGLRTGWFIDRDRTRRKRYMDARNYFTITNTVLGERLAVLALQHRDAIHGRAQRIASANLEILDKLFQDHAELVRWIKPRGGMTAFPWLRGIADSREFCRALAKCGILIVPGDCFGQPAHFRVGFAASGDRFPQAIERFSAFLRAYSK
jgi:aspartate/methionine/tyrosine aminotransferase